MSAAPERVDYPFSAVVGQDQLKLALILSAIAPGIGGVLIRGEKGTAKSTIVRGLGPLLGESGHPRPVVDLPIGATEDRVVGSLDVTRALRDGEAVFTPGLLARADRGVLYIDEVNLLADHLVDVLLDAAASGRVTVERDGISHTSSTEFVLVGTMNPEEGELRPQLLDRFGLAVDVVAARDVEERVEVVTRRLEFDSDPTAFVQRFAEDEAELTRRIRQARATIGSVELPVTELRRIAAICAHLDVDGMRGDIVVARAATAHAAWRGGDAITADDVRVAVELALPHRRRRDPFDESGLSDQQVDDAMDAGDQAAGDPEPPKPDDDPDSPGPDDDGPDGGGPDDDGPDDGPGGGVDTPDDGPAGAPGARFSAPAGPPSRIRNLRVAGLGTGASGRRSKAYGDRGMTTRAIDFTPGRAVHVVGTAMAAIERAVHAGMPQSQDANRRLEISSPSAHTEGNMPFGPRQGDDISSARVAVTGDDLRGAQRVGTEGNLVVFLLDLSGSMTARKRLDAVTRGCVDLLRDSYTRRDRVAVVIARGERAEVVVPPTRSVDLAVSRLSRVRVGGRTPLAEALAQSLAVISAAARREPERRPLLVVLTDGRATSGADALGRASAAARGIARRHIDAVVIDCEQGMIRLGLAAQLARHLHAPCLAMTDLTQSSIVAAVRAAA
ncbi:putative magnesium chelatase subunit [Gordonia effusa NBRC 100432]|uniref:Putative magnesium chelatase subunit n=1 Tax=Gordonia effusa NBRC 100432 TaxID=1077974 RepID=H0R249_9ACTN|nr:VWA domain-containing protein [Gordonia effusa]GAB19154.1 putative magnesium chelatase subunit [Gordonia effusa NBRC 100432]